MDRIKQRIKTVLRVFWEYKLTFFLVLLIACIALSGVHYMESDKHAGANISFNYSEASGGLNPNGTRFNSYEILSDDVLESAIERVGLSDTLTADELATRLTVTPVDTGNANGDDNYISTTYSITLDTSGLDLKNRSAESLLENVFTAYKLYFLENNGDNQEILKLKLEVTTDCEPFLRLNEIKLRVNQLKRYLDARMSQSRAFTAGNSFAGFDEFDKRIENIIAYDIPNTSAFIIECGVAGNAETLTQILEYKNKMDSISADKQMAYYEADNGGIAMYEELMSAIMMIPTIDETEQYYMSRTKTAMDKMARSADSEVAEATSYKREIVGTSYVIEKMRAFGGNASALPAAREMINRLETELNTISDELLVFDKSYINYKAQNYVTFDSTTSSFVERIGVKTTAVEAVALLAVMAVIVYIKTGRKENEAE